MSTAGPMLAQMAVDTQNGTALRTSTGTSNQSRVHGLIHALTQQAPGAAAGDPQGFHHGRAEQRSNPRNRSRDRNRAQSMHFNGTPYRRSASPRSTLGPQNAMDIAAVFDEINGRLDAVERNQRNHSQSIAAADEIISQNRVAIQNVHDNLEEYKKWMTATHHTIDSEVTRRVEEVGGRLDISMGVIGPNVEVIVQRINALEKIVEEMRAHIQSLGMAAPLGIAQPITTATPPGERETMPTAQAPAQSPGPQASAQPVPQTPGPQPTPAANAGPFAIGAAAQCAAAQQPAAARAADPTATSATQTTPAAAPTRVLYNYEGEDAWARYRTQNNMPERSVPQEPAQAQAPAPAPTAPAPAPTTRMPDARYMAPELFRAQAHPAPQVASVHEVPAAPPPVTAVPQSWQQDVPVQDRTAPGVQSADGLWNSPFYANANPFDGVAAHPHRQSNFYNPGQSAWSGHQACKFEISRKKNELLYVYTAKAEDFDLWSKRMVDHCCRTTMRWRQILEYISKGQAPIHKTWLQSTNIDGINAWELGNGFELWRKLFVDNKGNDAAIDYGGIQRLQQIPRYTQQSLAKLSEHLDDWTTILGKYGAELEQCPRLLRSMLIQILPKDMEEKIVNKGYKPEFQDSKSIIAWAKAKTLVLRTKELSELACKPPAGKLFGLIEDG